MPDTRPPERFVKKKKKGFGRGLLKILAGGRDRGLPPALHLRMMGTKRPTPTYGDNAMLVTLEIRSALNIKGLMPELLVENGMCFTQPCSMYICALTAASLLPFLYHGHKDNIKMQAHVYSEHELSRGVFAQD